MHRGEVFWGGLLVILGGLFLLQSAGYLTGDVFSWFWPIFIIAIGLWVLLDRPGPRERLQAAGHFSVPLQGAKEARVTISGGAGRIEVGSGATAGDFLSGATGAGMNHSSTLTGQTLEVRIEAGPSFIPFVGPQGGVWRYRLSADVPTTLSISSGASVLDVDLTDLQVGQFSFDGGASRLNLALSNKVENALVDVNAGAAGVEISVPDQVALHFRVKGAGSVNVNEERFPRLEAGLYQSPDYNSAKYRADVTVEGGATSVRIH